MKNTGKRVVTILLTLVMIITALLGNGIEARAAEYSLKDKNVMGYEFESGDVIIPYDAFYGLILRFMMVMMVASR